MDINNLSLKQKIMQMFITGFNGKNFASNEYFSEMLHQGLGGVIFFTHNIETEKQFRELIENISYNAKLPLFLSIDQEGGRVERTEKIHNGKKYLSAKPAYNMGLSYLQNQTKEIALELKSYGINMNFAPVLDVNTNKNNPIIGERAFSNKPDEVIAAGKVVIKEYGKYNIITVAKHFPGHGAASADSHQTLPTINLSVEEMENVHIKPFEEAIKMNIPAIMAAHVLYPQLDNTCTPASVSNEIINNLLIKKLGYNGIIMTDDMEMNGIKTLTRIDACIKAINAGVNMFIFRDTTKEIYTLVQDIESCVKKGLIDENRINLSAEKIINLKYQYGIIQQTN
ncbi:beta-N-acetylhexosaminidase [bacterium]|nr:beta-N-acetylhexosaminidase [bacterium]